MSFKSIIAGIGKVVGSVANTATAGVLGGVVSAIGGGSKSAGTRTAAQNNAVNQANVYAVQNNLPLPYPDLVDPAFSGSPAGQQYIATHPQNAWSLSYDPAGIKTAAQTAPQSGGAGYTPPVGGEPTPPATAGNTSPNLLGIAAIVAVVGGFILLIVKMLKRK